MAPQGRGRATVTPLHPFKLGEPTTPEERTPRALPSDLPLASSSSADGDEEKEDFDEDDIGLDSQYTLDDGLSAESVGSSDEEDDAPGQATFLRHSNSSFLTNAFAPPYYNRPPTPLPASPSLTSLLRPSFSTTTSRPTTPDSSEGDTPNDTEAAVAKSARTATTVPRASPKVPTYEYYGFVLYLLSSLGFREFVPHYLCMLNADRPSNVPPSVVSPFPLPPPAWYLLLPKPLVVSCNSVLPRHDNHLYIRSPGIVQYWLPHATYE